MEARAYANENRIIVMEDFLMHKHRFEFVGFKVELTQESQRFSKPTTKHK